ncbi:MAG: transcription antitermination factor NusB [Actinobacteria bacterium]|nr:transcription antitermination factor NusB [Actinomycetota bacterium]
MKEPKPLGKRTLARMVACGVLYEMDITGDGAEAAMESVSRMLREGVSEEPTAPSEITEVAREQVRFSLGGEACVEELTSFGGESFSYPGEIPDFARELVFLYLGNKDAIDSLIGKYADRWSLERMPAIDRNLLRLGIAELIYRPDIPPNVTINEYLELAKSFSTEDSGKFVNGVLGSVARDHAVQGQGEP